jgi:hypothetical protein
MYMLNNKRRYKKGSGWNIKEDIPSFASEGIRKMSFSSSHKTGGPPALGNWGAKQEL